MPETRHEGARVAAQLEHGDRDLALLAAPVAGRDDGVAALQARYPEQQATYRERSPIHHADRIRAPVAFFQGDEDEIMPPNQTESMIAMLRRNGVLAGYMLFPGEQHGFRQGPNIRRALDAELYFYSVLVFNAGLTF